MAVKMDNKFMKNQNDYNRGGSFSNNSENFSDGDYRKNDSKMNNDNSNYNDPSSHYETLEQIIARTGYSFDKTPGQHKYGGPPPNYTGEEPGSGHEIYIGKIPPEITEEHLIPIFEKCGTIYEMRLMMNPQTNQNKGFCFVTYVDKEHAKQAAELYNNYEIRPRKHLRVTVHKANTRLYVANIPKNRDKEMIFNEVSSHLEGLRDVIIYNIPDDPRKKNRGFAFLDFRVHRFAADAKKKLNSNQVRFFNMEVIADWADPQDEPDDEIMSKVKVLYIRNLKMDVTEEDLYRVFSQYGKLEKVKRVKDYGFIHYDRREDAVKALECQHNQMIRDTTMNVTLAKPPIDPKLKEQRKIQHAMMLQKNRGGRGGGYAGNQNSWGGHQNQYPRGGGGRGGNSYNHNISSDAYDNAYDNYYDAPPLPPTNNYSNPPPLPPVPYDAYDHHHHHQAAAAAAGGDYGQDYAYSSGYDDDGGYSATAADAPGYDEYAGYEDVAPQEEYQEVYPARGRGFSKPSQPPSSFGPMRGRGGAGAIGPMRGRSMPRGGDGSMLGRAGGGMPPSRGGSGGMGMNRPMGGPRGGAGASRGAGMGGGMKRGGGGPPRGARGMPQGGGRGAFSSPPPRGGGGGMGGGRGTQRGGASNGSGMFRGGRGGPGMQRGGGNLKRKGSDNYHMDASKLPRLSQPPPPPPSQTRFQQHHGGNQQQQQQSDGWKPQPIAQKPLHQLNSLQEQWF